MEMMMFMVGILLMLILPCPAITISNLTSLIDNNNNNNNSNDGSGIVMDIVNASSSTQCALIILAHHTQYFTKVVDLGQNVMLLTATNNTSLTHIVQHIAKVRRIWWCVTLVINTADADFLQEFSRQAVGSRAVLWSMKVIVLTSLSTDVMQQILTNYWTYSMMNTVLLNLNMQHKHSYDIYTNLPYSKDGGGVVKIGIWKQETGLKLRNQASLFPDKYSNFHGAKIPVTALILTPFWKVVNQGARDSWTKFSGRDCLLMKSVATALNFTFHMHKSSNIDEIMTKLENHEVLLSGFRIMLIPQILARVDHTYFIDRATFTFSMAKPSTKPQWQNLYYPLHLYVWLAILGLTAIMPLVIFVVEYHETDEHHRMILKKHRSPTMETLAILLGQDVWFSLPSGNKSRFVVLLWLVFAFVMGTSYRGTLTAFLSVPKYPARPENMQQLAETGVSSYFTQNATRFLTYFKQSKLSSYRSVGSRVDIVTSVKEGLGYISQNNVAFFHERYNSELMIAEHFSKQDGTSNLYVAKENVIPNYAAWMMPHDAPYKHNVDRWLIAVIESGLKQKFTADMMREAWQTIRNRKKQQQQDVEASLEAEISEARDGSGVALSITHLQGALGVLVIGLVMATAVLLLEIICNTRICKPCVS